MSDFESLPAAGAPPPQLPPAGESPFPLHALFFGPNGVRAGWRAALYVALFLLLLTLAATVGRAIQLAAVGRTATITPAVLAIQEGLAFASAILAALIMSRLERRPFAEYGMPFAQAFRKNFWVGLIWGIITVSVIISAIHFVGGYSFGSVELSGAEIARYAAEWAGAFLLVGLTEEFLFRGYLQVTLTSGMGFWPGAVLLSCVFGAVHLRNPGEGPVGALSVFVTGMFLVFTLRRTGTLWFAVGFHAAYDFGETFLYSVPDSGIVAPGHMLASSFHGPRWLTGGTVGPEASVFDFVMIAIAFVIFDRVYRNARAYPSLHTTDSSLQSQRQI